MTNLSANKYLILRRLLQVSVLVLLVGGNVFGWRVLIGAVVTLVVYGLLGGRKFCAWICPLNMVTDLANRLGSGFANHVHSSGRAARFWILGLTFVLSLLTGAAAFEVISPIGMLHRGLVFGLGAGWLAVLAVFLFDLVVMRNGFCGRRCLPGAVDRDQGLNLEEV